jgi:hypothetical protein
MFFSTIKKIGSLVLSGMLLFKPLIEPTTAIITNNLGNTNSLIPPNCGDHWESSFVINSNEDLDILSVCQSLNGSLYINGGDNIKSLRSLSNLRTIFGHLVILDSPLLLTLEGLQNLHNIYAYEKYLDTYSVSIKHNRVDNQPSNGLCFVNTFPWLTITKNQKVEIKNNAINCPDCHNQCLNCWDKYSYTGFKCKNYKSGDHCVKECPKGTNITSVGDFYNNIICNETIPGEPKLEFISKTYNSITFNIIIPQPNGVIRNISLLIDGELKPIYSYLYDKPLITKYTIHNLTSFTKYQLSLLIENYKGTTSSLETSIKTFPYIPFKPDTPIPTLDEDKKQISFQFEGSIYTYLLENNIFETQILAHLLNIDTTTGKETGIINTTLIDINNYDFSVNTDILTSNGNYSFQLKVKSDYNTWNISDMSKTIYLDNNPENNTYPTSFILMGVIIAICIILLGILAICIKTGKITKKCITDNCFIAFFSCVICFNYFGNLISDKCKKKTKTQLPPEPIYDVPNYPITVVPGSVINMNVNTDVNTDVNMMINSMYVSIEPLSSISSVNNPSYGISYP